MLCDIPLHQHRQHHPRAIHHHRHLQLLKLQLVLLQLEVPICWYQLVCILVSRVLDFVYDNEQ